MPWKFKISGDHTFQIIVPPHKGKRDYRLEMKKYSYNLKKKFNRSEGGSDDDSSEDETVFEDRAYSGGRYCQTFEFRCDRAGETAVYYKAAQALGRNLSDNLEKKYNLQPWTPNTNVRTRRLSGVEVAAESAKIDRSESQGKLETTRRLSSIGQQEYRCFPLYAYPNRWMTQKDLSYELPLTSTTFHDLRKGAANEIGWLDFEVSIVSFDVPTSATAIS